MAAHDMSSMDTFVSSNVEMYSSVLPIEHTINKSSAAISSQKHCEGKQKSSSSNTDEMKESRVSEKRSSDEEGEEDTSEFLSCTKIIKDMLHEKEKLKTTPEKHVAVQTQSETNSLEVEDFELSREEYMLDNSKEEMSEDEDEEDDDEEEEDIDTPTKKSSSDKKMIRSDGSRELRPKRQRLFSLDEIGDDGLPVKRKRGRPRLPRDNVTQGWLRKRDRKHNIPRIPGTRLKICSHCGTVAEKVKAKKCINCKKFFFSHWARRCKIPPCPNCHFSRKSRRFERFPQNCEKCGSKLPYEESVEGSGTNISAEDGDGIESMESSSTSLRDTPPDLYDLENVSNDGSEIRQDLQDEPDDCFDPEEEEMGMEEQSDEKRPDEDKDEVGKGEYALEVETLSGEITRSGKTYKHDTTPERIDTTLTQDAMKTPVALSTSHEDNIPSSSMHSETASNLPPVVSSQQETSDVDLPDKYRENSPQALLHEPKANPDFNMSTNVYIPSCVNIAEIQASSPNHTIPLEAQLPVHPVKTETLSPNHSIVAANLGDEGEYINTQQGSTVRMLVDREIQVASYMQSLASTGDLNIESDDAQTTKIERVYNSALGKQQTVVSAFTSMPLLAEKRINECVDKHLEGSDIKSFAQLHNTTVNSSGMQTMSRADEVSIKESSQGDRSVFKNIDETTPFLRSVLSVTNQENNIVRAQSVPAMSFKHMTTPTTSSTTTGTQSLPVLYTTNLGLEEDNKQTQLESFIPVLSSDDSSFLVSTTDTASDNIFVDNTVGNTPVTVTVISMSTPVPLDSVVQDKDMDMVVTESGTLTGNPAVDLVPQSGMTGSTNQDQPSSSSVDARPKPSKGKGTKESKPKKKRQPKTQESKEGTKPSKPKKPRTKKGKAMTAGEPEKNSNVALATSIAQELQRKPSISSPLVAQHSKHSFSQYFYSEDGKFALPRTGTMESDEAITEGNILGSGDSAKRSPSKLNELQEPPVKKKKLANIAPNNPVVTSSSNSVGTAFGQLPLTLPKLYQLATALRMSHSNILSLVQTFLPTSTFSTTNSDSNAPNAPLPPPSSFSAQNSTSLSPNLFPPLTMSFQSLAAALSNMPIATTPIRLSGTQVTARPLLPSTVSSTGVQPSSTSAVFPSMTVPSSLSSIALSPSESISNEQLALAQSGSSVGTQTGVKIDNLKDLMPSCNSSLSPQLLTLPNPPQLTSGLAVPPTSLPLSPPTLMPKDLKSVFQSSLHQLPSWPPPLTSSYPTQYTCSSSHQMSTSIAAQPPTTLQSNNVSSYMTLPMSSASMFTSLSFLPTKPIVTSAIQPLECTSTPHPNSILPPPPHLLPQIQHSYTPSSSTTSSYMIASSQLNSVMESETGSSTISRPLIPSLLRPAQVTTPDLSGVSSSLLLAPHPPVNRQKVIYTQSITSPKVCPGPQPASSTGTSVDSNLQVLVSNVQTRINEALSKTTSDNRPSETHPIPTPITITNNIYPLAPPPLTPAPPITFVSKGTSSSHPSQYLLSHHPSQTKRGVVITKLPGPLLSHAGELKSREGSRHSSTSSLKSGEDPMVIVQSTKNSSDAVCISSSNQPAVITLSPSPTASLTDDQPLIPPSGRYKIEIDSDKESDSYAKLMSEETLASDGSSDGDGEMGGRGDGGMCDGGTDKQQTKQQSQKSKPDNEIDGKKSVKKVREKEEVGREGGNGGERGGDGDKGKGPKKRRKSSSGGSGKKAHMFSVKLKDCFLHHLTWMDYRMVLLVPLGEKEKHKHKHKYQQQHDYHKQQQSPHHKQSSEDHNASHSKASVSSEGGGGGGGKGGGGGERRRRRKPVLKELSGYNDMEEDEDDTSLSTTSSLHVPGPCFSVYELRNKLFQRLSPNSVYIYTYKNQIKSFKLPIHWVYILKRMGGMLDSCHTCRLMDLEHVRGMCNHYGLSLPEALDPLCRNELPKGRKVIDLSSIEPESLGPLHLEEIPLCSFSEKGRPYKPKTKKSKKKWKSKDEEHRGKKKGEGQEGDKKKRSKEQGNGNGKTPKASTSSLPIGMEEMEAEEEEIGDGDMREEAEERGEGGRGEGGQLERVTEGERNLREEEEEELETEIEGWIEDERKGKHKYRKGSPPPLIKQSPSPISSRTKKKPCPFCGAQILKRSKKCNVCDKNFGVYTFGRKQCLFCSRVNLARMARCAECGQSLDKAPTAKPKYDEEDDSPTHKKSDFIFGVRKRRKVHSVALAFSGGYHRYLSSGKNRGRSCELPEDVTHGMSDDDMMDGEEEEEGEERREGVGEDGDLDEGMRQEREEMEQVDEGEGEREDEEGNVDEEEVLINKQLMSADIVKSKQKARTKSISSVNSKHTGYQYGHIPWADADITVLVDERGVTKFCLQELSTKVLVGHSKAEVFEMVRDLDLPLEQGNVQLLKKLQALGLHANRSPMCKLIASEELWLLLDALQEPVPDEVHQHLENINTSTTPLLSPSGVVRTPTLVATIPTTTTNSTDEEHQSTSFESTLHEMQCSDDQYISVLRKWNGEQFVCLPEIWRKYFPEVNRNHLSSALRRLELETFMPTGQQATLLRSAQVISIRGAPGRLMKLEHMQALLDDFSIPLQLATGHTQKHTLPKPKKPDITNVSVPKPVSHRPVGRPRTHSNNSNTAPLTIPTGKVLASKEDMEYAECMRHVLTAVESSELVALLEETRLSSVELAEHADSVAAELDTKLDRLGQLIHSRRELSTVLSREMGFINASVHGYMTEVVRLSHAEKQVLENLDSLLQSLNISLL